ncbi:MAG: hypothetical protein ACMG6E_08700 [Candidatus Roizmanbacteria bacterium]
MSEVLLNTGPDLKTGIGYLKSKLRFFSSGILYRNKRVHQKLRNL